MVELMEQKFLDCIEEVEVCKNDGEIVKIKTADLNFKYRTTEIKENKWIVVSALFKFGFGFDKAASEDKRNQRKTKHPIGFAKFRKHIQKSGRHICGKTNFRCRFKGI